jgi:hypothetical protein
MTGACLPVLLWNDNWVDHFVGATVDDIDVVLAIVVVVKVVHVAQHTCGSVSQ